MPHATIWIRREDWETWISIENKAEWVHGALKPRVNNSMREIKLPQFDKPFKVLKSGPQCKNGHLVDDWGYCMDITCKYGR